MNVQNILLPTDFSDSADNALTRAISYAEAFGATLHLLHVVNELDAGWYGLSEAQQKAPELRARIRDAAQERLQELRPDDPDVQINTKVSLQLSFDVAQTMLEYVDEREIDLVVMGTHGRPGLERLMLGSIAEKMIRHAPCPVVTVGEKAPWETSDDVTPTDVLAPVDFSDHSQEAVSVAKTMAGAFGAELHLLFVAERRAVPTFSDTGLPSVGYVEMDPEIVSNAEAALKQLNENVDGPDVPTTYEVRTGSVAQDVVNYTEEHGVEMIVMATRGLSGLDRFLIGSNTERIVRVAPCPVLTIPPKQHEEA